MIRGKYREDSSEETVKISTYDSENEESVSSIKHDGLTGYESTIQESQDEETSREPISRTTTFTKIDSKKSEETVADQAFESLQTKSIRSNFSEEFIVRKMSQFIDELTEEIESWKSLVGTPEEMIHVKNIHSKIKRYSFVLKTKADTRLLIGQIQNIFDIWELFKEKDLEFIQKELLRFNNGKVEDRHLKNFAKATHRLFT